MTIEELDGTEKDLWDNFVKVSMGFYTVLTQFASGLDVDQRIRIVRFALTKGDLRRAFDLINIMKQDERKHFWDLLMPMVYLSGPHSKIVTELILGMPKDYLIANVEPFALTLLNKCEAWADYDGLLYLFSQIDDEMTRRLAQRALNSQDMTIRELGQEYMEELDAK